MGGGGGVPPAISRSDPNWVGKRLTINRERYEADVNELLKELSSHLGQRDSEAIHRHVETIKDKLQSEIAETVEIQFGGSLSKHTYVDGISDVDALVVLRREDMEGRPSRQVIEMLAALIRERLPDTHVTLGRMAVTVKYSDGIELQLLPATKRGDGVRVPGDTPSGWSPLAHPRRFARDLQIVNARNAFGVIPAIKLLKAIHDAKVPEHSRLKGYHIEALALEAFTAYQGPNEPKAMLTHLVQSAVQRVLRPMSDTTGQSPYVDGYLGAANSPQRRLVASYLQRVAARIASADQIGDRDAWEALFGDGD